MWVCPALTREQVASLADDLRSFLGRIEAGDLDATVAMRHRIEGAIAVLDVAQGRVAEFEKGSET
jgi:predicted transcriptional regulator